MCQILLRKFKFITIPRLARRVTAVTADLAILSHHRIRTMIALPLPKDMDEEEKTEKIQKYKDIMSKVKEKLESSDLDDQDLSDFLNMLNIDYDHYHEALAVSERGKMVILRRTIKDRYVNNYYPMFLKAWNGNMDLQFCQDTYAGNAFDSCYHKFFSCVFPDVMISFLFFLW